MFRKQKLQQLKEDIKNDDRPLFVEDVLIDPETWATWDDVMECAGDPGIFDVRYLNSVESKIDFVSTVKLLTNKKNDAILRNSNTLSQNPIQAVDAEQLIKQNHSIIITNFEQKSEKAIAMRDFLLQLFYYNLDNHGVWPARIGPNSGHCHLYAGLKNSNSFPPHVDGPCNFIFQVSGENIFTVYENRKSSLEKVELNYDVTEEEREELYSSLRVIEERVMKPGDMVYVPSRQYHYVVPKSDRISLSFPLILKGPSSVML